MTEEATLPPAPNIGIMLGSAGSPAEFYALGHKWKLGHPTQRAKDRLEKLAAKKAFDEIRKLKGTVDPEDYQGMFSELTKQVTNKSYHTYHEGWERIVLGDGSDGLLFVQSLMMEYHPDITEEKILEIAQESPEEVIAALATNIPAFFLLLKYGATPEMLAKVPPKELQALNEAIQAASLKIRTDMGKRLLGTRKAPTPAPSTAPSNSTLPSTDGPPG
jgi:hypothetical protein